MLLIAFDTSTPAVTVALHDGASVVAEWTEVGVNRQGELDGDFATFRSLARTSGDAARRVLVVG